MAPGGRSAGNLPAELTSFVGRRDEMAEVRQLLAGSHLLTLTGIGGVGKTRLALRAAAGLARAFPDGVWLVRLDQLRDEALVAQAVAGALGLQERAGCRPATALAEHVASRRLLLVLDNCEHLIDAAARLADELLRAAPGLRVLATSREALNFEGETVLPVPPLAAPEPGQRLTVTQLGLFPAVALFVQRAGQARPGFAITRANQAAVAGICHRLEGLPLALELAAAQLRVLSAEQVDERLSDRLALLTRAGRARPARQRTLRASIEWSHDLCTGPEQLLWARASVFSGGFELDAAEGVCADQRLAAEQVLGLLAALVDKSVLIAEHGEHADSEVARYRLPETLREFGQEKLREAREHTTLRRRHRDWHEQLAARADTASLTPQTAELVARLLREEPNLRAAQDFCQAEPGEAEAGLRMAIHGWFYYYDGAEGHISETRYRLGRALAAAPAPTAWRARGLLAASHLAGLSGDAAAARPLLEEGVRLARQLNDPVTTAFATWITGNVFMYAGDLPRASACYADGLAALPASAAHTGQRVHLLLGTAISAGLAGDEDRAAACHRQIAALVENGGEFFRRKYTAYALWAVGLAAWLRGDQSRAAGLQQQSLRLREIGSDPVGTALNVEALAWIAASAGEHDRGAALRGAADGLWRSAGVTLADFAPLAAHQRECERRLRQALGQRAFSAGYDRGLELPVGQAVGFARQQPQPREERKPPPDGGPLTPRELQVARLVAAGHSNKQIAAELVISPRTAEGHIERTLAKLGYTSRAQLAAWVAASG